MFSGFIHLTPLATVVIILASTQMTFFMVSLYLHRSKTHGAITFHPAVAHVFRIWLWLTTVGVVTRQWVAVHRKHHAKTDTVDDPHSPQIHGIWKLLTQGTLLYRTAARDKDLVKLYGTGVHEDWLERNLYIKHKFLGAPVFLVLEMILFGPSSGFVVWLFQVAALPFWASGFINGLAHYVGYRNTDTRDHSRNLFPIAFVFCGEELHNNHHARPGSAKLSMKRWEFDMGWLIIRVLSLFRMVKINRI